MADSIVTQLPAPELPEADCYLVPKEIWFRYCRSYSTFMKRLNFIVREGYYREGAFRMTWQQDLRKRAYNQFQIHSVWGIEVLDRYFTAKNARW
jgi:hypothetical protein